MHNRDAYFLISIQASRHIWKSIVRVLQVVRINGLDAVSINATDAMSVLCSKLHHYIMRTMRLSGLHLSKSCSLPKTQARLTNHSKNDSVCCVFPFVGHDLRRQHKVDEVALFLLLLQNKQVEFRY